MRTADWPARGVASTPSASAFASAVAEEELEGCEIALYYNVVLVVVVVVVVVVLIYTCIHINICVYDRYM